MNQSQKLNLFVGLGCKPMKDVVLHHPDWEQPRNGTIPISVFDLVAPFDNPDMFIETIPEKLPVEEQHKNAYGLCKRYKISIEMIV